jgi:uncharacterized protein YegP (UPF0339 family)
VIRKTKDGQFRAYFSYNKEKMFWTEAYTTKAAAMTAIESIKANGPGAPVRDGTKAPKAAKGKGPAAGG